LREGAASAYLIISTRRKKATFYDCFFYFNSTGELTPHKYYSIKTEKAKR
jgi:hypothetical protein